MALDFSVVDMVLRIGLAVLLGAAIGIEREWSGKPAGLRTHMMVCLGAAAFTLVTLQVFTWVSQVAAENRADPLRIVDGIIGGIGFLGAGTIIRSRGSVEGITTAASIWVVGAIGVACGIGAWSLAATVTVFALVIVSVVGWVEAFWHRRLQRRDG